MSGHKFTVIENSFITLGDGTRLAARIWMPDGTDADPVPAVFEFLPYRKGDGTCSRDEATYPEFAKAGIAGVRVDIRGSGESDGVIDGEYTELELANAVELIAWIAKQSWCNGSVGMMGISWGGFNCLQVAALNPPALKAVISIASTVDRYNDDIHYKNGCQLAVQLSWAATMLAYQSRTPDPALVGDDWRNMWLHRLEQEPFFLEEWLAHQTRDEFWKHASICEDFDAVKIPSMVLAGWADGYRNTPIRAIEGMPDRSKALIGPWVHKYPHFAWPKPRADFIGEAVNWWNKWLRDEDNGADTLPQMRAYILEGIKPAPRRDFDPGFWVAKDSWSTPETRSMFVAAGKLSFEAGDDKMPAADIYLKSPLDTGTASGEYFTLKPDAEMAIDQRGDDAGSLVFETTPLDVEVDLLGRPVLNVDLECDADWSNLCARLVDVHPDGTATRVSFGVLNLAHRDPAANYDNPQPMPRDKKVTITLTLDACGYRFKPGHRIRLALSTSYWPMILPPPFDAGLTIAPSSIKFDLPLLGNHEKITVKQPENPDPLPTYIEHKPSRTERSVQRNLTQNETRYRIYEDTGLFEHPDSRLATRSVRSETWTINPLDPNSMRGEAAWTCDLKRDEWSVRTDCHAELSCDRDNWFVSAWMIAYEDDQQIFEKKWEKTIPRNFM